MMSVVDLFVEDLREGATGASTEETEFRCPVACTLAEAMYFL